MIDTYSLTIIGIILSFVATIFAVISYYYSQPKINFDLYAEKITSTQTQAKISITVDNTGGRNIIINEKKSYLLIRCRKQGTKKIFELNFRNLASGRFEEVINNNGIKLRTSFVFDKPIQIISVVIVEKYKETTWQPSKISLGEINILLAKIFS